MQNRVTFNELNDSPPIDLVKVLFGVDGDEFVEKLARGDYGDMKEANHDQTP